MNWTEIFHEYLSEIYWKGYAQQMLEDEHERYQFEFEFFLATYQ